MQRLVIEETDLALETGGKGQGVQGEGLEVERDGGVETEKQV